MEDLWLRIVDGFIARTEGPLHFRLILQPVMAIIFAVIAGLRDARLGNPPYFWGLFTSPGHRREMLKDGWKSVGKVLVLAWVLDVVYQLIVIHTVRPGGALFAALTLAIVPYLLVRGLVTRIARKGKTKSPSSSST